MTKNNVVADQIRLNIKSHVVSDSTAAGLQKSQENMGLTNVLKHEMKVPKVGNLEAIKASRLKKLSSNQVTGFRLRNIPPTFRNSQSNQNETNPKRRRSNADIELILEGMATSQSG